MGRSLVDNDASVNAFVQQIRDHGLVPDALARQSRDAIR
jgi:hypothetical protein